MWTKKTDTVCRRERERQTDRQTKTETHREMAVYREQSRHEPCAGETDTAHRRQRGGKERE